MAGVCIKMFDGRMHDKGKTKKTIREYDAKVDSKSIIQMVESCFSQGNW